MRCHYLQLLSITCRYLQPFATICHYRNYFPIFAINLPLLDYEFESICPYFNNWLPLFAIKHWFQKLLKVTKGSPQFTLKMLNLAAKLAINKGQARFSRSTDITLTQTMRFHIHGFERIYPTKNTDGRGSMDQSNGVLKQ